MQTSLGTIDADMLGGADCILRFIHPEFLSLAVREAGR
jgi:hypothetical protein